MKLQILAKLKDTRTSWKYILIMMILALFVSGGILSYTRYFEKEIMYLTQFSKIKKPEKVVDETIDWISYKNEEYGFEMKYPEDWYVYPFVSFGQTKIVFSNLSEKEIEEMIYKVENKQGFGELENKVYVLEIKIIKEPFEEWLRKQELISKQLGIDFLIKKITVGKNEGYKIFSTTKEGQKGFSIVLSKGNNVYLAEALFPKRCRFEECEIFRSMLSTFKFLR